MRVRICLLLMTLLLLAPLTGCGSDARFARETMAEATGLDCSLADMARYGRNCSRPKSRTAEVYCYHTLGDTECYDQPVPGRRSVEHSAHPEGAPLDPDR